MRQRLLLISIVIVFVLISGIMYISSGSKDVYSYQVKHKTEESLPTLGEDQKGITDISLETELGEEESNQFEPVLIGVYVCGAVEKEGVYYLVEGSRVVSALELAGGLKTEASSKHVNLARVLVDGEIIFFPTEEEGEAMILQEKEEESSLVNINTADKGTLMSLPGIGEAKALAIIDYRTKNQGFNTIEEIMKVSGIKDSLFSTIRTLIRV